jgi:peroxiredoxin family protein
MRPEAEPADPQLSSTGGAGMDTTKKTIIVFSGDFDKMMAAFIIANGAAAMGDDVTMFFTFWGLNALRKPEKVPTAKKSTLQAMFGRLMPRGAAKLGLSTMNFAGMGAPMMKKVMKQQNVMTLDELIASAREQDVKLVACTMSMDVMGFKEEELMDGLEYAGVGAYLGEADEANVNLFI